MINRYVFPDGTAIDLNQVLQVGPLFVNKNNSQYSSYEIYLTNGESIGVFESDLSRDSFITTWDV